VQRLGQVAALRNAWSAKACTRWGTQQRPLLRQGHVAEVLSAVRDLCRGRHSQALRRPRASLIEHQSRMAYAQLLAWKLPLGSGALESSGRRVVNLRVKGPSLFWCRARAEAPAIALLLQGGSVGHVATYGHFTLSSTGNLTGKLGSRPFKDYHVTYRPWGRAASV